MQLRSARINEFSGVRAVFKDAEIRGITIDSRNVNRGDLFICLKGQKTDGHAYIEDAVSKGAVAVVVSSKEAFLRCVQKSVPVIWVRDTNDFCWEFSALFYGNPSEKLTVIGVTGTNGKTTTAWLLYQIINTLGRRAAYMGTLGVAFDSEWRDSSFTTPFPPEIQKTLRELVDAGADTVVMEVSSHALHQRRVDGVQFDVGIFTNLSQDHFDYHSGMEDYFRAKSRLFCDLPNAKKIVTVAYADDPYGKRLLESANSGIGFGSENTDLRVLSSKIDIHRLEFEISWKGESAVVEVSLGGHFNVNNCLAAIAGALALNFPLSKILDALKKVKPAPGRFETITSEEGFHIIVDYAHTPDALEKLLNSVRALRPSRILTVFGCGGDRDRNKRPKMASVVSSLSDLVYVTSDNPRTENPMKIIEEIVQGLHPDVVSKIEPDRAKAIHDAVFEAKSGDIVVIAGKGHETYQIIGTTKHPFDDRVIARKALEERKKERKDAIKTV
ncbi:MAG TPA: UDP-N-acetylmuramoyl-L-alanyl-D-glutamate--2,6-diaminopimelate ligase [Fimbriimonadales bacterium]|nr:UDP-N-acetylmuramoyl-L-alanyl-D-glutamate--2,6-diaminopimelate ligase [Fimbriimonadales bacterium]